MLEAAIEVARCYFSLFRPLDGLFHALFFKKEKENVLSSTVYYFLGFIF